MWLLSAYFLVLLMMTTICTTAPCNCGLNFHIVSSTFQTLPPLTRSLSHVFLARKMIHDRMDVFVPAPAVIDIVTSTIHVNERQHEISIFQYVRKQMNCYYSPRKVREPGQVAWLSKHSLSSPPAHLRKARSQCWG